MARIPSVVLLLLCTLLGQGSYAQSLFRLGMLETLPDAPPHIWQSTCRPEGDGVLLDLLRQLLSDQQQTLKQEYVASLLALHQALGQGAVDGVLSSSPERYEGISVRVEPALLSNHAALFVRQGSVNRAPSAWRNEDLQRHYGRQQPGGLHSSAGGAFQSDWMRGFGAPQLDLTPFTDDRQAFQALLEGQIDYLIADYYSGFARIHQQHLPLQGWPLQEPVFRPVYLLVASAVADSVDFEKLSLRLQQLRAQQAEQVLYLSAMDRWLRGC